MDNASGHSGRYIEEKSFGRPKQGKNRMSKKSNNRKGRTRGVNLREKDRQKTRWKIGTKKKKEEEEIVWEPISYL